MGIWIKFEFEFDLIEIDVCGMMQSERESVACMRAYWTELFGFIGTEKERRKIAEQGGGGR